MTTEQATEQVETKPFPVGRGNYATVNSLRMYYEIHGTGKPLVLLHGGAGGIEMFGSNLSVYAGSRQAIAVDYQFHGYTADIDRPLRYEFMADDVAALMDKLGIKKTDVMGTSLGGGIALQVAVRHPGLVENLVLVSTVFKNNGFYPEVMANFEQMGPQTAPFILNTPLGAAYPDKDWGALFTKIHDLQTQAYDWSKDVAAIKARTMLVFADADAIRPEHVVEFYQLLGGWKRDGGLDGSGRSANQLAILPGLTHYQIEQSPALAAAVLKFLGS
jgi:pimeloyl-ACP methyl ester carboxylesterase